MARLIIHRDSAYADYLRAYRIILDGKKIGEIANGETKEFTISAGQHELSMKIDWCGSGCIQFSAADDDAQVFLAKANVRGAKLLMAAWFAIFATKSWIILKQASEGGISKIS
jgi:hypothetical protein